MHFHYETEGIVFQLLYWYGQSGWPEDYVDGYQSAALVF